MSNVRCCSCKLTFTDPMVLLVLNHPESVFPFCSLQFQYGNLCSNEFSPCTFPYPLVPIRNCWHWSNICWRWANFYRRCNICRGWATFIGVGPTFIGDKKCIICVEQISSMRSSVPTNVGSHTLKKLPQMSQ